MDNSIQIFNNNDFGNLRTIDIDGKTMFCGKDVALALGYKDTVNAIKSHCKSDGVVNHHLIDSKGRNQDAKFISEGNVYRLISRSKLPEAEKFESWVFDEVVPTIRKTGSYGMIQSKEDLAALAVLHANDNSSRLFALAEYKKIVESPLINAISQQKPMVDIAEQRIEKKGCLSITDVTRSFKLKKGQITNWAKNNGYIHKSRHEVNEKGLEYFKVYSDDMIHNSIGITESGVEHIRINLDDIKNTACKTSKNK